MSAPPEPPENVYDDEVPPVVPPSTMASPPHVDNSAPPEPVDDSDDITKRLENLRLQRNTLDIEMNRIENEWAGRTKTSAILQRIHDIDAQTKNLTISIAKENQALKSLSTGGSPSLSTASKRSLLARRAASKSLIPAHTSSSPKLSDRSKVSSGDLRSSPRRLKEDKRRQSGYGILTVDDSDASNQLAFRELGKTLSETKFDSAESLAEANSALAFHIEPLSDDEDDQTPPEPAEERTVARPRASTTSTVDPSSSRTGLPSPQPLDLPLNQPGAQTHSVSLRSTSSELHAPAIELACEYYEISQVCFGGLHVGRRWLDNSGGGRSRPTERAWSEFQLGGALSSVADTAATVMRLLDRYFVEKPGRHRYQSGETSHAWDPTGPCPKGLPPKLLAQLCFEVCKALSLDPPMVRPTMPTYVLGDVHGNYKDLSIFARAFWPLGIDLCPAGVLFLGDYVDRGPHSVEVAAHILALKLLAPHKVFMLRGNHEISELNGNVSAYGSSCFKGQCTALYGPKKGEKIWSAFNEAFRFLPVAAVVGQRIFCVHGGIPRATAGAKRGELLTLLDRLPTTSPQSWTHPTIMDLLWADPATPSDERKGLPERVLDSGPGGASNQLNHFPDGYAPNSARGPFTCIFGRSALDSFLAKTGCSHVIRAHQPPRLGIDFRHDNRIITVFSSSHYCGAHNAAAAALIADFKIRVVLAAIDKETLTTESVDMPSN